jgi:hypothetical protein
MASDIMLLIVMLVGLLRTRQTNSGITRHLYIQVCGAMFCLPVIEMNVLKLGLGPNVACRSNHSGDSCCCEFSDQRVLADLIEPDPSHQVFINLNLNG